MNLQRCGESGRGGVSAGCVPVRALWGWCLLRRLVYSALRPPTQPTYRQTTTETLRAVGLCPFARWGWCPLRGLFYARCAHPPNRPKTPTRERAMWRAGRGGHSLRRSPLPSRTIPIRPPPLYGGERCPPPTAAGFFVRCRGLLAPVR